MDHHIAIHTGMPLPIVTRKFYDDLVHSNSVNGLSNSEVLESFKEAIADLSREEAAPILPAQPDGTPPHTEPERLDPVDMLTQVLAACGAKTYKDLVKILSRKPVFR